MRRPWLAFLLSAILPGLGQLYAGAPVRAGAALLWVAVLLPPAAIALLVPMSSSPAGVLSALVIVLGLYLIVAVDAWGLARVDRPPSARNRPRAWAYVLFVVAATGTLWAARTWIPSTLWYRTFGIPTASMGPTIEPGDFVIVDMSPTSRNKLQRGLVVVFESPLGSVLHLDRLIGLPGDTVEIRKGVLRVNGVAWSGTDDEGRESFAGETGDVRTWRVRTSGQETADFGPVGVPEESVFVLGDDRDAARDSREFGPVPVESVRGRVIRTWFSVEPAASGRLPHPLLAMLTGRVRWERIGREPFQSTPR